MTFHHRDTEDSEITGEVIASAIDVHRALGPGLLESAYEECLARELSLREVPFVRQLALPVEYKGVKLDCAYRVDFLVRSEVVVELKAAAALDPIHQAQLLTYMRLDKWNLGLLINFNVPVLKLGIKRFIR